MKKTIFLVLVALLLISGCETTTETTEGPFIGGTQGLSIEFKDLNPSTEFYQGEDQPVKVIIKNNGEYEVAATEAQAKIYGIVHSEFSLSDEYKATEGVLIAREKGVLEETTGEQVIDLGILNYQRDVQNLYATNLKAKVCYPYQTEARVSACASSLTTTEAGIEQVCTYTGEKATAGTVSSGPIQLTSFTETTKGTREMLISLEVSNLGSGEVYRPNSDCTSLEEATTKIENQNMVKITIDPADIVCSFATGEESNTGEIDLSYGPKTLVCTMQVEEGETYTRDVAIYLDYTYIESTTKPITVLEP